MERVYNLKNLLNNRRELRKNQTPQEQILWWYLRNDQLGYRFRRQFSVGGYILDFYCPKKKLGIEVDGAIHNKKEVREYDKIRNVFFANMGFLVLRFSNDQIEKSIKDVLDTIKQNLRSK
ncbi:MAG TPA: DUF559 domain-containing protein [Candidatus Paceibacterota bacterium]